MKSRRWSFKSFAVVAALSAVIGGSALPAANAAPIDFSTPLPSNAQILFGGHYWAWAAPDSNVDLSVQGQFGWRLPTAAELANAPTLASFLFPGANVPQGGFDPNSGSFFATTFP